MATTTVNHPLFARGYERTSRKMEARGQREHRHHLLDRVTGEVVEVGAGNGLNFPLYPANVTRVVAVEPERYLRRRALAAAETAPVRIDVVDGVAETGFVLESVQRFAFKPFPFPFPTAPHVLGIARRPA